MQGLTYTFNISSDEQFDQLSKAFGRLMESLAPKGGKVTRYKEEDLFAPLQIGVTGAPASGKSTFFRKAIALNFPNTDFEITEKQTLSFDQTRMVKLWKRWVNNAFEIRMQDQHALAALGIDISRDLPQFDRPGIRIFEHVYDEIKPLCEVLTHIEKPSATERFMHITAKPEFADLPEYQQFLEDAGVLRIA